MQDNQDLLKLLEKFGFKFFGYDESNNALVVAPNGQIVNINVAYNFVKNQINKVSSGNGPEAMPSMPQIPTDFESGLETAPESEKNIEKESKREQQSNQPNNQQSSQPIKSTQTQATSKTESPYGDGFKLSINPADVDKVLNFIQQNSKKSNADAAKWLAIQFSKYYAEVKSGLKG